MSLYNSNYNSNDYNDYNDYNNYTNNVINFPYIDYIIKAYVPELQFDEKYKKVDMKLFRESMLHHSTKQKEDSQSYERLEYLGDSIFHMIISEYLYKRYDEESEGFLTRLRIRIERGDSMAHLTKLLELDPYIQIYGLVVNEHILEDVFEAFLAAFYLNFKEKYTRKFIINLIEKHKNLSELIYFDDNFKDLLLRYFHQMKWDHPKYKNNKTSNGKFISVVKSPFGIVLGTGTSNSVKKAEQSASELALIKLGLIIDGEVDQDWLEKIEKEEKDEKKKEKNDKKSLSVFNPANKLMKAKQVKETLLNYNIVLSKDLKIKNKIFCEAMTHRSYLVRKKLTSKDKIAAKSSVSLQKKSNQRLQFLGDSVIHFVLGEYLYHKYVNADEGFLTRLRCKLENKDSLFYLAKQTNISSYLLISQNLEVLSGRTNVNIIGGGFEAFVGALYLEFGISTSKNFILEVIRIELDIAEIAENETNYKDSVIKIYLDNHWGYPEYKKIKESGPDHSKIFTMGIYLHGKLMAYGKASSKRKAEQIASKKMCQKFQSTQDSRNLQK